MGRNVILRPVYNRPEMLYLSLEYEIKARQYFQWPDDLITLFIIEYGSPGKTLEVLDAYPFKKQYVPRTKRHGLTINILEGMKDAFSIAEDYVIYIEDDILLHKTYFEFMNVLLSMEEINPFSVLLGYSPNDNGDVNAVDKTHIYAALAPLINKKFYFDYIFPCSGPNYYKNPAEFVKALNESYKEYWKSRRYKYTNVEHWEQAGLINRLVDVAMIEEGVHVYRPEVNRQVHIGYYGKNRPGGKIPGNDFDERLKNLREIIKDSDEMYKMSGTPQYKDYKTFSPKLEEWNGTLHIKGGTDV
jgi:hypothetical protein